MHLNGNVGFHTKDLFCDGERPQLGFMRLLA